jgi:uncharacterized protein YlxW (UPF0749 family)
LYSVRDLWEGLDGIISLSILIWLGIKQIFAKNDQSKQLVKDVEDLKRSKQETVMLETRVTQLETKLHSLSNHINTLTNQVTLASKEEQERTNKIDKKIDLMLFGLQTVFLEKGMDLNKYKDVVGIEKQ